VSEKFLRRLFKPKIDFMKLLFTREWHFDSIPFVTINDPIFVNLFMNSWILSIQKCNSLEFMPEFPPYVTYTFTFHISIIHELLYQFPSYIWHVHLISNLYRTVRLLLDSWLSECLSKENAQDYGWLAHNITCFMASIQRFSGPALKVNF
jgi:hypothetical protein